MLLILLANAKFDCVMDAAELSLSCQTSKKPTRTGPVRPNDPSWWAQRQFRSIFLSAAKIFYLSRVNPFNVFLIPIVTPG